jgi:hypothetical protein
MEKVDIDRERIVNGDRLPKEYFCSICRNLLWKPRSCSTCQHLFGEKCIQTWIKNPTSSKRCPFRCEPFEDCQCPPYVQSLLSHVNIHCQNSEFGCKEILSYDQLENHQNIQCKYLSQQCSECDRLIRISKLTEHQQTAGLCIPSPIKCTICENYIEKTNFREHFHRCCKQKITTNNEQTVPANAVAGFLQSTITTAQLFEQQKQMSQLPTSLKGVDEVRRVQEQNRGHFYHVLIILKFLTLNWSKSPYFILILELTGFIVISRTIIGVYNTFCHWTYQQVDRGSPLFLLLSYLSYYATSMICQSISDTMIIFFLCLLLFSCGCMDRGPLEIHEMYYLINKTIVNIIIGCIGLFILKIILLLT